MMRAPSDSDLLDASRRRRVTNRHIPPFVTTQHELVTMVNGILSTPLVLKLDSLSQVGDDDGTLRELFKILLPRWLLGFLIRPKYDHEAHNGVESG